MTGLIVVLVFIVVISVVAITSFSIQDRKNKARRNEESKSIRSEYNAIYSITYGKQILSVKGDSVFIDK